MTTKWEVVLDMGQGVAKACGSGIELTVNPDMFQAMAVKAHFIIMGVVWGEGCSSKVTSPMDLAPFYSL